MPFALLYSRFPEVAREETRTLFVVNQDDLPPGHYSFAEMFCDESGCDCRRVLVQVYAGQIGADKALATISFGWEPESFYRKWASFPVTADDLLELKGPALAAMAPQSELAPALLRHFKMLLADDNYKQRIIRHYKLFRSSVSVKETAPPELERQTPKAGRNEPCPCGSGKKHKKCCGRSN